MGAASPNGSSAASAQEVLLTLAGISQSVQRMLSIRGEPAMPALL